MNETRNRKVTVVRHLPRKRAFSTPIFESDDLHKSEIDFGLECSVCNNKFQESDELFSVWLGNPDMKNAKFDNPEMVTCEQRRCQETAFDKASSKLAEFKMR